MADTTLVIKDGNSVSKTLVTEVSGSNLIPVHRAQGEGGAALASEAKQDTINSSIGTLSAKFPATLGAKSSANSFSITFATDTSFPLANNAATELTLSALSAKLPASLGSKSSANSISVVFASDATVLASEATANNIANRLPSGRGPQSAANSISVTPASGSAFTVTVGNTVLAANAASELTLAGMSAKLPPALGTQSVANSISVVVANTPLAANAASATKQDEQTAKLTIIADSVANTAPVKIGLAQDEYRTVAASQTANVLGTTGAIGDYLAGVLVIPANTSPGSVAILDNATSITVFTGGADSVTNLVPFYVPLGIKSVSGAWKVTTGASVSVVATGDFT